MWKLRLGGALGEGLPAKWFLHSGMRCAAFNRDRFRRALCLGLSIADGLGQHLAQLDFSLWRFAREGFCPCCHRQHMGMPQGELNPRLSRQGSNVDLDGGFEFTPHSSCLSWVKIRKPQCEQMFSAAGESYHGRGGDKILCTLAEPGTGQYCSVFESIPLRNEPGLAKAGMIITGSGDALPIQRE